MVRDSVNMLCCQLHNGLALLETHASTCTHRRDKMSVGGHPHGLLAHYEETYHEKAYSWETQHVRRWSVRIIKIQKLQFGTPSFKNHEMPFQVQNRTGGFKLNCCF